MASDLESACLTTEGEPERGGSKWLKVGLVAAGTAAAGLAAAWWYRKTLARLREAEEAADDTNFRILDE